MLHCPEVIPQSHHTSTPVPTKDFCYLPLHRWIEADNTQMKMAKRHARKKLYIANNVAYNELSAHIEHQGVATWRTKAAIYECAGGLSQLAPKVVAKKA